MNCKLITVSALSLLFLSSIGRAQKLTSDIPYVESGHERPYATYQLGGREWAVWSRAMEPAIVGSQRRDGDQKGSWDPVGPWGHVGGRVYSTALMTLCLEVYYRYGRVLGGR